MKNRNSDNLLLYKFTKLYEIVFSASIVTGLDNWKEDMNEEELEIHKFAMENGK